MSNSVIRTEFSLSISWIYFLCVSFICSLPPLPLSLASRATSRFLSSGKNSPFPNISKISPEIVQLALITQAGAVYLS